jgi:hypothetical protein
MLTTESQPRVQGKQLDMAAAIAELEKALSLAKTLQQCRHWESVRWTQGNSNNSVRY